MLGRSSAALAVGRLGAATKIVPTQNRVERSRANELGGANDEKNFMRKRSSRGGSIPPQLPSPPNKYELPVERKKAVETKWGIK